MSTLFTQTSKRLLTLFRTLNCIPNSLVTVSESTSMAVLGNFYLVVLKPLEIDHFLSSPSYGKSGVPQGSVLGTILFLLYIYISIYIYIILLILFCPDLSPYSCMLTIQNFIVVFTVLMTALLFNQVLTLQSSGHLHGSSL